MLILQIIVIIIIAAILAAIISVVWAALITEGKGTAAGSHWGGVVELINTAWIRFVVLWIIISAGLMWLFL